MRTGVENEFLWGLVGAITYKTVSFYTVLFIFGQALGYKCIFHINYFGLILYINVSRGRLSNQWGYTV